MRATMERGRCSSPYVDHGLPHELWEERTLARELYAEGRVLGSQTGLPRFKSPAGLRGPRMGRRVD